MTLQDRDNKPPEELWSEAFFPKRSMMFHVVTSTTPFILMSAILLWTNLSGSWLIPVCILCGVISFIGFSKILYEITLDIAGFEEFVLPVWSVLFLMIDIIAVFAFIYFAMHISNPGYYFKGFAKMEKVAFMDALYLSISNYILHYPDGAYSFNTRGTRYLLVFQSFVCMFLSMITITEFITSF